MAKKAEWEPLPLPRGVESILIALSGGPDSMYLLHRLLPSWKKGSLALFAAHLDHGLRRESAEEAAFLQAYCANIGLPLAVERLNVKAEAAQRKEGIEETARRLRHGFLRRQMEAFGADCIALGHHMDDQVETMLLRLGRGSGLTGLCAMRTYRPPLWRPLLSMRKAEILAALQAEAIPYCTDASNESMDYARNRTRKILEALEDIHPRFVKNAARSAGLLQGEEDLLQSLARETLADLLTEEGLDAVAWQKLHPALGARVLRLYAQSVGLTQGLYAVHSEGLEALCRGSSGRQMNLPQGFLARLDQGHLRIIPEEKKAKESADFALPLHMGENATPFGTFHLRYMPRPEKLGQRWPAAAECNPASLENATLRPPRPGDRMQPLGMKGHKKLSDIWTDKKIPLHRRNKVVVANGEEVLLLPGLCLSARCDAAPCREVWEIRFEEEKSSKN